MVQILLPLQKILKMNFGLNNSTAKAGQILAEARITFEDRPSGDSDNDANDTVFSFSILFQANEENSEFTKVIP